MKTFTIFLLSRLEHDLFSQVPFASYFQKRLSKQNFILCHYLKLCHGGLLDQEMRQDKPSYRQDNVDFLPP